MKNHILYLGTKAEAMQEGEKIATETKATTYVYFIAIVGKYAVSKEVVKDWGLCHTFNS